MNSDLIALQARADGHSAMLRRDGYREAAECILELRQALYAALAANSAALAALNGGFPMEADR